MYTCTPHTKNTGVNVHFILFLILSTNYSHFQVIRQWKGIYTNTRKKDKGLSSLAILDQLIVSLAREIFPLKYTLRPVIYNKNCIIFFLFSFFFACYISFLSIKIINNKHFLYVLVKWAGNWKSGVTYVINYCRVYHCKIYYAIKNFWFLGSKPIQWVYITYNSWAKRPMDSSVRHEM